MLVYIDVPEYITKRYDTWISHRNSWMIKAILAEEMYLNDVEGTGTMYTREQLERIKNTTNIPVTINYTYPIISHKLAILTSTKPSHKVITNSDSPEAKQYAYVLDKMKYAVMRSSTGSSQTELAIRDALITGIGLLAVVEKSLYADGEFDVAFKHLPKEQVILDPNCLDSNLDDMEGYFIEKEITRSKAAALYNDLLAELSRQENKEITVDSLTTKGQYSFKGSAIEVGNEGKLWVREFYDKVFTTMYLIENIDTGGVDYIFEENLLEEQKIILDSAVDKVQDVYVRKFLILGDKLIYDQILPVTGFPITAIFSEWGGHPYRSYGMIHFTVGMQQALDKAIQLMLLNGMLANNAGYKAPKGSIAPEDRENWEKHANNPLMVKEYNPVIVDNQVLIPEREQIGQLSNFYPMLTEMMKQGIEYSTGINPMIQGNPTAGRIEVFSSLQQYTNAAMQRISVTLERINISLERLGDVLIQYLCANLKPEVNYMMFDEQGKYNEIKLAVEAVKKIRMIKFKLIAVRSEAMPTQKMAMATELMKIAQTSTDPSERDLLMKKAFDLSDMRGFDELSEEMDKVRQLSSQLQQMQQGIEQMQQQMEKTENKCLQLEYDKKVLEITMKAVQDVQVAKVQAEAEITIEKLEQQKKDLEKDEKTS